MASKAVRPASSVVYVADYTDPDERRPPDENAVVFKINRQIPILTYLDEINKFIKDDKSFDYIARISNDRVCVVFKKTEQAAMIVEEVGKITVNNQEVEIKYFVPKSVKIIISNAASSVSNSALKKYLVKDLGIQTFSSIAELKTGIIKSENGRFSDAKCYRRVVYIHPGDVLKLPQGPVRFMTSPNFGYNVFFEVYNPKCYVCNEVGHFRDECPHADRVNYSRVVRNTQKENKSEMNSNHKKAENIENAAEEGKGNEVAINNDLIPPDENVLTAILSPSPPYSPRTGVNSREGGFDATMETEENNAPSTNMAPSRIPKRAYSVTSSASALSAITEDHDDKFIIPVSPCPPSTLVDPSKKKQRVDGAFTSTKKEKKAREVVSLENASLLKPAKEFIGATKEKHKLSFDKFTDLLTDSYYVKPSDRKGVAQKHTHNLHELTELLATIYTMVVGKKIKRRISGLKKALEVVEPPDESSSSSESEHSDLQKKNNVNFLMQFKRSVK